ncbi:MAG: hypothetical protein II458_03550 [Oscillospiraceae bacterium]|nr:hypothetical protein [Oscillospiraceae bacterium]
MKNTLKRDMIVYPGVCDYSGNLGVPDAFGVCMDLAAQHANSLGIGMWDLAKRSLFWLTVKTRIRFLRRPRMGDVITGETWPEPADRIRCNRDYRLWAGNEVLAVGKTEWAVVNTETGKLQSAAEIYPAEVEMRPDAVWDEPFARLRDDFDGVPVYARHTVSSTDIDIGGHMNNVAYVWALAESFSTQEWMALNVRDLEIHFKASCYEGQTIELQRRERDGGLDIRMSVEGRTVVLARIG